MENGIYTSENAIYLVKDNKIAMNIKGSWYRTTENFMNGAKRVGDMSAATAEEFDTVYKNLEAW